jgi:signal peptidase I
MEKIPEIEQSSSPLDTTVHTSPTPEHKEGMVGEIIRFSLIALLIVLPIRLFIAQPFIVSGASMETTFATGQYLIVDQLTYHFDEPQRGDVIVFRYPKDPSKFFIKRVIGIPGDTIHISGREVTLSNAEHPDGVLLDESYILDMKPSATLSETLGENEYFVMGDNRDASSDSRAWGVLQRDKIVGRAFLRLFPLTEVGVFPGEHNLVREMGL